MATLHLTPATTVAELRKQFNDAFGAQVRVYCGRSIADLATSLSDLGLNQTIDFECRANLTVSSFIERMQEECGLKVKVYTCDEWVAVLDGLTLESAGKVKKNAVKADMENMIAYQRVYNSAGFTIQAEADGSYTVLKDGIVCENAKAAMREMAESIGFVYDATWTTRQFGSKLLKFIETGSVKSVKAEDATLKSKDVDVARKSAEEKQQQAEAELARQKAEAEAAQKELDRIKAETAKAQAEAAAAKVVAEKAAAEAAKAKGEAAKAAAEQSKAEKPAATTANKGVLQGLFSVAANKKVHFSMGNLQFNPKKYEFRFALHQYDRIGNDNTKIAPNYDGWIDLFGYGTSGYMGCEPTETNTGNQYRQDDIANTNYDWGIYNPISNGGNKEGLWRTLTKGEWEFLFSGRANATKLRAKACVNGINGAIILPDDFYEHRVRVSFDSTPDDFAGNTYDLSQWATLEAAGAVFLPCCGKRKGIAMASTPEDTWVYWTSSGYNRQFGNVPAAYYVKIFSSDYYESYFGRAVRLVQDVK